MNSLSCLKQKVFVMSVKLSSSLTESKHIQYHARCICKDSAPCLPALTTSPVTEGMALFHYVLQALKFNDLTKDERERFKNK